MTHKKKIAKKTGTNYLKQYLHKLLFTLDSKVCPLRDGMWNENVFLKQRVSPGGFLDIFMRYTLFIFYFCSRTGLHLSNDVQFHLTCPEQTCMSLSAYCLYICTLFFPSKYFALFTDSFARLVFHFHYLCSFCFTFSVSFNWIHFQISKILRWATLGIWF